MYILDRHAMTRLDELEIIAYLVLMKQEHVCHSFFRQVWTNCRLSIVIIIFVIKSDPHTCYLFGLQHRLFDP